MDRDARIQECLEQHRRGTPTALSISLGASSRDASATLELGGRRVHLARVGTDGDRAVAERLFGELDGRVDAFGLGGADLGMRVGERWYPFLSVLPVVRGVRRTPLV